MKLRHVLEAIAYCQDVYGSLTTSTECSRRDVMRAVDRGLAKSVGLVRLVHDGDGPLCRERFREGFVLTAEGARLL